MKAVKVGMLFGFAVSLYIGGMALLAIGLGRIWEPLTVAVVLTGMGGLAGGTYAVIERYDP